MSDVKLTFINESNDQNNSSVVFFQKNDLPNYEDIAIAWKVINNCATGWKHKFVFPTSASVSASDAWGNEIIDPLSANLGDSYSVFKGSSGDEMAYNASKSRTTPAKEIQIHNDLEEGSIDAQIYKADKLLASKTGVSPGQKAAFQLNQYLWVGVVSQLEEGETINSAIVSSITTKLGLSGIQSADVVMTGGGTGVNALPFNFELRNILYL